MNPLIIAFGAADEQPTQSHTFTFPSDSDSDEDECDCGAALRKDAGFNQFQFDMYCARHHHCESFDAIGDGRIVCPETALRIAKR